MDQNYGQLSHISINYLTEFLNLSCVTVLCELVHYAQYNHNRLL